MRKRVDRRGRLGRAVGGVVERLECRRLLAGVVINEFLADNSSSIVDQDNDHSDWIEIRNTDATPVNLGGWCLTDDAANLTKWQFPSTTLAGGGYLVVFASGKDRAVSGQQLHTNFALEKDGEYLALVKPGGTVVADSYDPYPPQLTDVSYGKGATSTATDTFIGEDATMNVKVPTAASSIDSTWRNLNFTPDGTWLAGQAGVGYDTSASPVDYSPYIGVNVQSQMSGTGRTVAYVRVPFTVADPTSLISLKLQMQYDDGFVAYLNGTEIGSNGNLRRNFPAASTPAWNSIASSTHADDQAIIYEDLDLTQNLNLLVPGNNVLAIHGLNVANSSDFLISPVLTGDRSLSSAPSFMTTPSPGAANNTGTLGFVGDTHFSLDRGFYDAPISVAITTSTPAAQIRYTLDGSVPTATSGTIYTGPIAISTTKTLRAAAFKTGWTPTNVDTQTYIFLNDVIHQTGAGLPPYATWGHNGPDWEMDPNVVNNPAYSGEIKSDLQAVPSMSLTMPWNDLFGSGGQGIYISGSNIERGGSVEMIAPPGNDTQQFQTDAALEIQGASSSIRWNNDKLSFRVTFKQPYGSTKLNTALFTDPQFDQHAATKFDTFILDSVYDDSWMSASSTDRDRAKFIQDQYAADLQNLAGSHGPHGRYVHLYLDGLYWGLYYLHERPDDGFAESYLGGDKDDYDVLKHNASTVVSGSTATSNYSALLSAVRQDMSVPANYNAVAAKLDIDDFIDYMVVNQYIGNSDWASHNWYASYNRVTDKKWRFHSWDAEISLRDVNTDNTTKNDSGAPTEIHTRLMASPEYKLKFNDAVQRLLTNGGLLTPARAAAVYQARVDQVNGAMVGESARWGDSHKEPPYTRADWRATQNGLQANYFPQRTNILLGQYSTRGWTLALGAPIFNQYGGTVNPGFQLTMAKPAGSPAGAVIYYTLDNSDPRVAGTGAIGSSSVAYSGPITLNVAKRIKARIFNSGSWSALVDQAFVMPTSFPLRIVELHYHPATHAGVVDAEDMEFIELLNTGSSTVNLSGVQISGAIQPYTFGDINLAAGQRIVVPGNIAVFDQVYGAGINRTATAYSGKLDNAGEQVILTGAVGETLQNFIYDDTVPWPEQPDGHGPSLEIIDPLGDPSDPTNWRASVVDGGTPGSATSPPVVLSSSFKFATGHSISFVFDHDLDQSSVAIGDLDVQATSGGSVFHSSAVSFPNSKTATFAFASLLTDGNYHASLQAGSVKDTAGAAIVAASDLDFFALSADANHDRHVDAADQAILTAHLGAAGTFAEGDFDYSGTVNSSDQAIFNAQSKLWLPAVGALSLPASGADDSFKLRRETATVMQLFASADISPTYRLVLSPLSSLSFAGGAGNDTLVLDLSAGDPLGGTSLPLNFDGGNGGADVLRVLGSAAYDNVTITASSVGATLTYAGVEDVRFDGGGGGADVLSVAGRAVNLETTQNLSTLSIDGAAGAVSMPPGGGTALIVDSLTTTNGGKLELHKSSLIVLSTSADQAADLAATASAIQAGTIASADAAASGNLTALGVAAASKVFPITDTQTAVFAGQTVHGADVLVKYTYDGDANLDGKINVDDYGKIDFNVGLGSSGWINGDFNYDGKINVDDYGIIDFNVGIQGPPLAGAGVANLTASAFVPAQWDLFGDLFARRDDRPSSTEDLL